MELVRFFTAGNVDDGKSTLIGRLLFDSNSVSTDIIETLTKQSKIAGADTQIDLALLTDGLRAEREQGITIDVAYKYFSTEKRKFIIADTPGHIQYTRNMFTGASNADIALILLDARHGITEQTKRHSIIASILGIPNIAICINKMDLLNYNQERFAEIEEAYRFFAKTLNIKGLAFIPLSALSGENVVHKSENLAWYTGPTLLEYLETTQIDEAEEEQAAHFQVQYVIRPQNETHRDYRAYAGSLLSGSLHVGEQVRVLPGNYLTRIAAIEKAQAQVEEARQGEAVLIHLSDNIDVSRGTSIVSVTSPSNTERLANATLCWMDSKPLQAGQKFILQHNSFRTRAVIQQIEGKIDIHSLAILPSESSLQLNDFAQLSIKTAESVSFEPYAKNRKTGAFILIDESTNNTAAAGVFTL